MAAPSVPADAAALQAALGPDGEAVCRQLLALLRSRDRAQAESAARTLKKIAEADAHRLYSLRRQLLRAADTASDLRVQWNLTVILGLLPLQGRDRAVAIDLFFRRLDKPSPLNRTFALQALANHALGDAALHIRLLPILDQFVTCGTPAMQARARKVRLALARSNDRDAEG